MKQPISNKILFHALNGVVLMTLILRYLLLSRGLLSRSGEHGIVVFLLVLTVVVVWFANSQAPQTGSAQKGTQRTIRDFSVAGSIWPVVDEWAAQEGFTLKESGTSRRLYHKGGAFTIPIMLHIQQQGDQVHLEAWAPKQFSPSPIYLLLPDESALDTGGYMMSEARRIGRAQVNPLLARLDQPLIL